MFGIFGRKSAPVTAEPKNQKSGGFFSTDTGALAEDRTTTLDRAYARTFQKGLPGAAGHAMDSDVVKQFSRFSATDFGVPDAQIAWYASQGFIGYQLCAMLGQNWLIDKACTMPARDAIRIGYDITNLDGGDIDQKTLDQLKVMDQKMKLVKSCEQFVRMGNMMGIRHALFVVESTDKNYYEYPFNPKAVKPGTYRGISQIDPIWITPALSTMGAVDPASMDFYEPLFWIINGKKYHKSHFHIMRGSEVPDQLKPTYRYGGVSITQKVYERVYAAERTANEAPQLAMTKRLTTLKVDMELAVANQEQFEEKLAYWVELRNNYGIKAIGGEEEIQQFDTSLADLDAVISTQYSIVAAAANVPVEKLMGTTPKGFNSTGEYEEASYREYLESIQTHELSPLINRHHQLCLLSEVAPGADIQTTVVWKKLDSPTAEEQADINLKDAQADQIWFEAGAIDAEDIRDKLISNPNSGYNGLSPEVPEPEDDPEAETQEEPDANGQETKK